MADLQRIAKALVAITLASGGVAALRSGKRAGIRHRTIYLIGNGFLLLGALVWT
jgi:hypothetical protein